jgi:hypothetical protein
VNDLQRDKALLVAAAEVRSYGGGSMVDSIVRLFDALSACYLEDLRNVAPEQLVRKQAAIKQVDAIKSVLLGDPNSNGRI